MALPVFGSEVADRLIKVHGKGGGVLVVVANDAALSLELARRTEGLIYLQVPDATALDRVCRELQSTGLYGTRVFVGRGDPERLHLADNLADQVVTAMEAPGTVEESQARAEALRVLRPQGKAWLAGHEWIKPIPDGIDDWSHPYHGPDNNPASRDQLARGPYLTQFMAEPRYAPLPQLAVAAGGRVFKLFGHIAFKEREEPWLNTMAAFNGYNGALLWRRPIPDSLMVHRNVLIATAERLYFGDDRSCKVIDAATGELVEEIMPPEAAGTETFWKWMALEDGVLYGLIGEQEKRDPVIRLRRNLHGWPWDPLSPGFNAGEYTWGYGRTLVALRPGTQQVLWTHQEEEPMDSRALCMSSGRLFVFRFGAYLACLDAKTGEELWRCTPQTAPGLFTALGGYSNRQDWRTNWRSVTYAKCSDEVLYFAGPQVGKLLAVSVQDGRLLWEHPYNNYQLVLLEDGLYALSGQIDQEVSRQFDPLTGEVLAEIKLGRRACSRPTGAMDAVFCRASGGSTRLELTSNRPQLVSPMRAQCHDGVTIAQGLLYWWPSVCDCNLTLYGITALGSAGAFEFDQPATTDARREPRVIESGSPTGVPWSVTEGDWPVFRADAKGTAASEAAVPSQVKQRWSTRVSAEVELSPITAVEAWAWLGGSDGIVRALQTDTGEVAWEAFTGGAVRLPPTISDGRALVGSGDGWVYCYEAVSGRLLWRFRAAPTERRIPVYGQLLSTWPAASGVLVENGVAYVAAGIVNYDGTHVYALDAATGKLIWHNGDSGHLDPVARSGVSVQGHMVINGGKLYLAGGNAVSPAIYDLRDGRCLNDPELVRRTQQNNVPASVSPRGWELYCVGDGVMASGKPYYSHPAYGVYDDSVFNKMLVTPVGDRDLLWMNNARLVAYRRDPAAGQERYWPGWGRLGVPDLKSDWERACEGSVALAVGSNAAVVATAKELQAVSLEDGKLLWRQPLSSAPVPWGVTLDRKGRILVSLTGGEVVGLAAEPGGVQ